MELQPWANYVAKDEDGVIFQFADKPSMKKEVWACWADNEDPCHYQYDRVRYDDEVKCLFDPIPWDRSLLRVVRDSGGAVTFYDFVVKPDVQPQFKTSIPDHLKTEQEIQIEELQAALEDARMTLRDQFAMHAMQAYFTDPDVGFGKDAVGYGAQAAYRIADAMLEARK